VRQPVEAVYCWQEPNVATGAWLQVTSVPNDPKIYHITHVDNLPDILSAGCIWSDAKRIELGLGCQVVGMSEIKRRRLEELEVKCYPGTMVGEYAPFFFCPRSVMLYMLYRANHPSLTYRGGQGPIIHLQADVAATVKWAEAHDVRWAFSDSNAGAYLASFFSRLGDLDEINWEAVRAAYFRDVAVKEGKQAEFLLYESFPWELVERIGVQNSAVLRQVNTALGNSAYKPPTSVEPSWYF